MNFLLLVEKKLNVYEVLSSDIYVDIFRSMEKDHTCSVSILLFEKIIFMSSEVNYMND